MLKKIISIGVVVLILMGVVGFAATLIHTGVNHYSHCDTVIGFDPMAWVQCAGDDIFQFGE